MIEVIRLNFVLVNTYLIKGTDGFILIDSGVPFMFSKVKKAITRAGCEYDQLKLIILTHGDIDHTGNAVALKKAFNTTIAMHKADYAMVKEGQPIKRELKGLFWKIASGIYERIVKPNPAFEIGVFLNDGQRLDDYGVPAQVMHLPGHTPGSIAVLTDDGQLISGDIISNQNKPEFSALIEKREIILASLERIKQTQPEIIFPGHGKPFFKEALETIKVD